MVESQTVSAVAIVEQLGKTFTELKSHMETSATYGISWEEIKQYFDNCEGSLLMKHSEIQEKEKALEEKKHATQAISVEKKEALAAKQQSILEDLQEVKDAAVATIKEAYKKFKEKNPQLAEPLVVSQSKVSISVDADDAGVSSILQEKSPGNRSGEIFPVISEVKPHPELLQLCEKMDSKGLLKYLSENQKNLANLRKEIPIALKSATNPAQLVLDSLHGFYPKGENVFPHNQKDTALLSMRRNCLVLMESAAQYFGTGEPMGEHPLNSEVKQQAKAIADEWKAKSASVDIAAANGNSLEAYTFLQIIATFCVASEFDEEQLCELVLAISHKRQAPALCRSLGLTHKMPGVIESLVKMGKQIDAVHFIHAFNLQESFPPVPLLKDFLTEQKNAQGKSESLEPVVGQDVNTKELSALRAVIKCIEEYKLQSDYPLDPLKKRATELEKTKLNKKRMSDVGKFQAKKPRVFNFPQVPAMANERGQIGAPGYDRQIWTSGYDRQMVPAAGYDRQITASMYDKQVAATGHDARGFYYGGSERYPYSTATSSSAAAPYNYHTASRGQPSQQMSTEIPYPYHEERTSIASYGTAGSSGFANKYTSSALPSSYPPYM